MDYLVKKSMCLGFIFLMLFSTAAGAENNFYDWLFDFSRTKGVEPVSDELYLEECGACHFPYQPGFLPEQSWKNLLNAKQLEDHFGENAELEEVDRRKLESFVLKNSADKSWYKRSRKIMSSLDEGQFPIRLTETPYIKLKHSEIPDSQIKNNDKVNSLSFCDNCHRKAKEGIFDDNTVFIPK